MFGTLNSSYLLFFSSFLLFSFFAGGGGGGCLWRTVVILVLSSMTRRHILSIGSQSIWLMISFHAFLNIEDAVKFLIVIRHSAGITEGHGTESG